MRIATFNVENMFERPTAMNLPAWKDGKQVLEDCTELNDLVNRAKYTDTVKKRLLSIMKEYKGLKEKGTSDFIVLQEVREKLLKRPKGKPVEVAVSGRSDWGGWFELKRGPVRETSTANTARVVKAVSADVQCIVEAEDRITLMRFVEAFVNQGADAVKFGHIMLVDGNDERGIDVGILCKPAYPISAVVSHIDDTDATGVIFSRDCPEYRIKTPKGNEILVMINHLKSKGYGGAQSSNAKRKRQAQRVREIYDERRAQGIKFIAIVGDFNDTPGSDPLKPLLENGSDLTEIMKHPKFAGDGRDGTFGNGSASQKIDYILLSPELAQKVTGGGIERRGVWGGTNGTLFPHFPEVATKKDAASDHAALWAEIDI